MSNESEKSVETTMQLYANPVLIQNKILDMYEQHVFDNKQVMDGNNVFTFLLEMQATMAAGLTNEMLGAFRALYPSRAEKASDLYRHMADYDYLGLFATPTATTVELMLDRDFLINNAPIDPSNPNRKLAVLPASSVFKIGVLSFGIYYPINISIFKQTADNNDATFQVTWDNSIINPLHTLQNNTLEHRIYTKENVNMLCISIPVYQFEVETEVKDVTPTTGFIRRINYKNKFYACRVFRNNTTQNTWEELATTLSDNNYDVTQQTTKLKVLSDINTVEIIIPQVYLNQNFADSNKIMILMYTTQGSLDIDIRNYEISQFSAAFTINDKTETDTFSKFLRYISLIYLVPLQSRLIGGGNGYTFEELRNRVIYDNVQDLLITPTDITAHLATLGFVASKFLDNITNRIYVARCVLTDGSGGIIKAGEYATTFSEKLLLSSNYSNIKQSTDPVLGTSEYVVLPTNIFRYDNATDCMIPLSDSERAHITQLSTEGKVDYFNSATYTFTPFHVKLLTDPTMPISGVYDLLKPTVTNVTFVGHNTTVPIQANMFSASIFHNDNGAGGYQLRISLYTSNALDAVSAADNNIVVALVSTNSAGGKVYTLGKYLFTYNKREIVAFDIPTEYQLDSLDRFDTTAFCNMDVDCRYTQQPVRNYFKLEQEFELRFYINADSVPEQALITSDGVVVNPRVGYDRAGQPEPIIAMDMIWLSTQKMLIKFGNTVPALRSNLAITFEGQQYKTYDTTSYATHPADVYFRTTRNAISVSNSNYTTIVPLLNKFYTERNISPIYVLNTTTDTGDWYARSIETLMIDDVTSTDIIMWTATTPPENSTIAYADNQLLYTVTPTGVDIVVANKKDSLILSSALRGTASRPPAFDIIEPNLSDNQLPNTVNTLYMREPFVATANMRTLWGEHPQAGNINIPSSKYRVESTDLLGLMLDKLVSTTSEYMCRTVHTDAVTNISTIHDPLYEQYFVYIEDTSTAPRTSVPEAIIQPVADSNYAYELVQTAQTDNVIPNKAIYRRDIDLMNFNHIPYMDTQTLGVFWERVRSNGGIISNALLDEFDLEQSIAMTLWQMAFPWKKAIAIYHREDITALAAVRQYWDTRYVLNATFADIANMQTVLLEQTIATYDLSDDIPNDLVPGTLVWCTDITTLITSSAVFLNQAGQVAPLTINLSTPLSDAMGAILRKTETTVNDAVFWDVIITGPDYTICRATLLEYNTFSGIAYIATDTALDKPVYIALPPTTVNTTNRTPMVSYDVDLCSWSYINKWPWELDVWTTMSGLDVLKNGVEIKLNKTKTDAIINHAYGDIIHDGYGRPIPDNNTRGTTRDVVYRTDLLHCDYRPLVSTEEQYVTYRANVLATLRGYFDTLDIVRHRLLEQTELYFAPVRTIGRGRFKSDTGTVTKPLEITIALRLHTSAFTDTDTTNRTVVESTILKLIDAHLSEGVLSTTKLATDIRMALRDTVHYVDVLGINGDLDLQTLISADSASVPQLKLLLQVNSDGTIGTHKALTVSWSVVK